MKPSPAEFRYRQNLDRPWPRRVRAVWTRLLGFDPAPPDDVVERFAAMYYDADPLAEAFVDEVYLGRSAEEGRAMLDLALERGVGAVEDAPTSLVEMLADIETDPAWVDQELVEHGARVFRRYGSDVFRFAGAITLEGYAESSVAKPLALTGGYTGDSTRNRFLETANFWIAVSDPGGMRPGAPGRLAAMRVRIMHVFVRRRLLDHPEWDLESWGVPINQGDAMMTLMGGSFIPGVLMRVMGYRPSAQDIEAMMHFWRYVGHVMGVRPTWYPSTLREAAQLCFVSMVKGARTAGDDERSLCQSYAEAFRPDPDTPLRERWRDELSHRAQLGFTRVFVRPSTHRRNRLPRAGIWALHPLARFPFLFTAETLRRHLPKLDDVADRVATNERNRWLQRHTGGRPSQYRPVSRFTR